MFTLIKHNNDMLIIPTSYIKNDKVQLFHSSPIVANSSTIINFRIIEPVEDISTEISRSDFNVEITKWQGKNTNQIYVSYYNTLEEQYIALVETKYQLKKE